MDEQNLVPEVVFLENLDSDIGFFLSDKYEVLNDQHEHNSKENYPNINNQIKLNSGNLLFIDQIQKKNLNAKYNTFQGAIQEESCYSEQPILQRLENKYFNSACNSSIEEEDTCPGFRNFKLEWDKENDALYIVIPSVDSLDHWMMLFLQPLGITNESLCLNNCCFQHECDFKIRLDDERLLLYPDLLKDISDFITIQNKKWQFYKKNVILRDVGIVNSIENKEIGDEVEEYDIHKYYENYSKLPNINVFLNNDFQKENGQIPEYRNSIQFLEEKKLNQDNIGFNNSKRSLNFSDCHLDIYGKYIEVSELLSRTDEPINSNKLSLSCLTTSISDTNLLAPTDSNMLSVLTSENSSHDENYFGINPSINNSTIVNEKDYFPI